MSTQVAGYCPMGCGETLSLMAGGHVTCRKLGCPRPDAVSELLADNETEHIVVFGEDEFTLRHPLRERLDDALMSCQVHADIAAEDGPPLPPGRYRIPAGYSMLRAWEWQPAAGPGTDGGNVWADLAHRHQQRDVQLQAEIDRLRPLAFGGPGTDGGDQA